MSGKAQLQEQDGKIRTPVRLFPASFDLRQGCSVSRPSGTLRLYKATEIERIMREVQNFLYGALPLSQRARFDNLLDLGSVHIHDLLHSLSLSFKSNDRCSKVFHIVVCHFADVQSSGDGLVWDPVED